MELTTDELTPQIRPLPRILRGVAIVVGVCLLIVGGMFALWYNNWQADTARALPEALTALESDPVVRVERGQWITFEPAAAAPTTGVIFYPGGRIDERAYAPAMREVAEAGYLAVIVPMPLDLPVLGQDRAAEVMADYPQIETWVMAGHSLGASAAASFVAQNPQQVDGIALWAGFPPRDARLNDYSGAVTAITATEDGYVHERRVGWYSDRVPRDTVFVSIEGGNHAQFAYYEVEPGGRDGAATISAADQQTQVVSATLELLDSLTR